MGRVAGYIIIFYIFKNTVYVIEITTALFYQVVNANVSTQNHL